MADVRINDLPSAASWNGFFPQDKPGGSTECVSVATVEAKLVEDGFVKTATLVAGYQPLENQRLRTTDSPTFAAGRIAGLKIQDDPVITTYGNIYGSGIATPSDTNWSASFAKDGSNSLIRGQADVALQTPSSFARLSVSAFNISNKLQIAGVDRITNVGGFVGTSLQISGATANKLARFDASKNLVSYDLTLTIGATGKTIDGTGNQSWSLAEIGAQAAGSYLPVSNPTFTGTLTGPTITATGDLRYSGGVFRDHATASTVTDFYASGVATPSATNYSLAIAKTGDFTYLNAATEAQLNIAGTSIVSIKGDGIRASNMALYKLPAAPTIYGGIWGVGVASPGNANYSLLLNQDGSETFLNATTGGAVALRINNSSVVSVASAGATLAGTTTLSGLTGATTRLATINAAGVLGVASPGVDFPRFPISKTVLVKRGTGNQTLYTRNFSANEMNVLGKTIKVIFYATALNPAQGDFEVMFGNMSLGHCGIVFGVIAKFEFVFSVQIIGTSGKFCTAMVNSTNNGSVCSSSDWGAGVNLTIAQTFSVNFSQTVDGTVIINQMSVEIIEP